MGPLRLVRMAPWATSILGAYLIMFVWSASPPSPQRTLAALLFVVVACVLLGIVRPWAVRSICSLGLPEERALEDPRVRRVVWIVCACSMAPLLLLGQLGWLLPH